MRQELISAARQIETMEEGIRGLKDKAKDSNTDACKQEMSSSDVNNQILALKAKHEEGKETFESDIKKLQE